jgi:hypothetical protein
MGRGWSSNQCHQYEDRNASGYFLLDTIGIEVLLQSPVFAKREQAQMVVTEVEQVVTAWAATVRNTRSSVTWEKCYSAQCRATYQSVQGKFVDQTWSGKERGVG